MYYKFIRIDVIYCRNKIATYSQTTRVDLTPPLSHFSLSPSSFYTKEREREGEREEAGVDGRTDVRGWMDGI